jgi:hypothetical protein
MNRGFCFLSESVFCLYNYWLLFKAINVMSLHFDESLPLEDEIPRCIT